MPDTKRISIPIYRQILIIFILLLILIETILLFCEFMQNKAQRERLLAQSYVICSSILSNVTSGHSEVFPPYSDDANKLTHSLLRSFAVYRWNRRWEPELIWGRELFHPDYLEVKFSNSFSEDEFERYAELRVWKENYRSIVDLQHPNIVSVSYTHLTLPTN